MEEEKYVDGVDSIQMRKGLFAGYGVYATNRRLFGVKRRSAAEPLEIGKVSSSQIEVIRELERRHDFEIRKDDIISLEMKSPPGIFRMGHLLIRLRAGNSVEVKVGKKREYDQLRKVMMMFYPEAIHSA